MPEHDHSKRAIPVDSSGVARLIGEFHSHLAILPPVKADRRGIKPVEWDEEDLEKMRRSVRDPDTGIVDIEAHIRGLVQYTEIPFDVVRNISLLSLGRIARKLILSQGAMAFRHGTFLRMETDPAKVAEVFGARPRADRGVINVWPPGSDLSRPPLRRVPVPLLQG